MLVSEKLILLITKGLIFGFQILDLKDHFSYSMIEGLLLPWQQIYHLIFIQFLEQVLKFVVNFTLLKSVSLREVNDF